MIKWLFLSLLIIAVSYYSFWDGLSDRAQFVVVTILKGSPLALATLYLSVILSGVLCMSVRALAHGFVAYYSARKTRGVSVQSETIIKRTKPLI